MDQIIIDGINSSVCGLIEDFQLSETDIQFKSDRSAPTQSIKRKVSNPDIERMKLLSNSPKSEFIQQSPDESTEMGFGEDMQVKSSMSMKTIRQKSQLLPTSPRNKSIIKIQEKSKLIIQQNKFNLQESLDQQLTFQHKLQQNSQFFLDLNEQIFRRILDKNEMDIINKSLECQVLCTKKPKIQCCFCGKWVCANHCTKQRQNPLLMNKFHDICNLCDDKYLKKVMCEDYLEKCNLFDNFIAIYEQLYGQQSELVRQKIDEKRDLGELIQTEQQEYMVQIQEITNDICEQRQDIQDQDIQERELEEELMEAQQELNNFDYEMNEFQQKCQEIRLNNCKKVQEIQNMLEDNQEKEYIVNFLNQELKNSKFQSKFEDQNDVKNSKFQSKFEEKNDVKNSKFNSKIEEQKNDVEKSKFKSKFEEKKFNY